MSQQTIPARPMWLLYAGWACGAVFFFYAWVLRVAPSVMVDPLMRDLAIGAAALGNLSAFYFYAYAGAQVPVGLLLDRFGPRRLMTAGAAVCATGCLIFAYGDSLSMLLAGRLLIGLGGAYSLVGAMAVAGQWFPPDRFAMLSGWAMLMGMLGGVFGQATLRGPVETIGWRDTMGLLAVGGFVIAVACWVLVRDRNRGGGGIASMARGLRLATGNRQTWLIAIAGMGATAPLLAFAGLWGVPFLQVSHDISVTEAARVTALTLLGFGVSAPVAGWISNSIRRRLLPYIVGSIVSAAALAAIVYLPGLSLTEVAMLSFLCGAGGSAQVVGFACAREANPPAIAGTVIGLVNGMVTGSGAVFQPLLGWILDANWDGRMNGGARIYDITAYKVAFGALMVSSTIGVICLLLARETYCRQHGSDAETI